MNKLLLFDGHSILSRAFYGLPNLTNSKGIHTNAVYGFLNIMFKILDEEKATHLAVAFDLPKKTFRHIKYEDYKGTRKSMPDELIEQVPLMQEVLKSMNVPIYTKEGFEADDILGTLAKTLANDNLEVSIVSGDRDLLQLSDTHIKIRIPKTSKGQTIIKDYYPNNVVEEYGVSPLEFIDVKALMGDSSDNIPGVPSIGEKTATNIIKEYKSIENAYANVESLTPKRAANALKEHYDKAVFSKFLATIKIDVPLDIKIDDMLINNMENGKSFELINSLEFKSLIKRFDLSNINMNESLDYEYEYIDDFYKAKSILEEIKKDTIIALQAIYKYENIENTSLKKESIDLISLTFNDSKVYLIRLLEKDSIKFLNELLSLNLSLYTLDLKSLLKHIGTEYKDFYNDLSLMAYLINPLKDSYEIEDLARDFFNLNLVSKSDLLSKKDLITEIENNNENAIKYACNLSFVIYKIFSKIEDKLRELGLEDLYNNIELPLTFSLAKMELVGIGIDKKALGEYANKLESGIKDLEKKIYELSGTEFNINSPKQLGEILFEKLGLQGGKKTKTGYSTAADILEKLAVENEVVNYILEYRQLTKLHSTYAIGLANYIADDNRIHGKFNQTIAATGRISSTEPNLQNIPIRTELGSKLRDIFVAKENYSFIDADYSQIELRVLADMSGDIKLIDSYKQGKDIHSITASNVFNTPLDEVSDLQRRNAKAVNFGVVYGISGFGLSRDLSISRKDALDYINNYFKTYVDVKKFLDEQVSLAKEKGYVKTIYGRIRPIPEIKSSNFMQRAFGDRVAMNSPIQGSAADIMKLAMISVDRELEKSGLDAKIVLQVHDELLVEASDKDLLAVKDLVENTMKNAVKLKVALEVEANIGKTWLEAK